MSRKTNINSIVKNNKFYIFEITPSGALQKVSLIHFSSKEQADDEIKKMWHPMHRMKLIAAKALN